MSEPDFLSRLQAEANLQAKLQAERWLPAKLDPLATFISQYPWQTLVVISILTSIAVQLLSTPN